MIVNIFSSDKVGARYGLNTVCFDSTGNSTPKKCNGHYLRFTIPFLLGGLKCP